MFAREVNLIGLLYRPACVLSLVISSRRGEQNCSQLLGLGHHHIVPGSHLDARPFPAGLRAFRMNRVPHHYGWRGSRDHKSLLDVLVAAVAEMDRLQPCRERMGVSLPANHATSSGFVTPTIWGGGAGNQTPSGANARNAARRFSISCASPLRVGVTIRALAASRKRPNAIPTPPTVPGTVHQNETRRPIHDFLLLRRNDVNVCYTNVRAFLSFTFAT